MTCPDCGSVRPLSRRAEGRKKRAPPAGCPRCAPGGILRGKYRLIERLGEGAHGVTWLAEHEFLGHPCVVKFLPPRGFEPQESAIAALRTEARSGYRVNDPHVVRVLDCDVVRGTWYFVMEYIDGIDLAQVAAVGRRLPWRQVVRIGLDAARGLAAIHRSRLVHRDVKPANLILGTDGDTRVADLGVARLATDSSERVGVGAELAGTLAYAPPEMFIANAQVGRHADLFSLGAALFHLATGRAPIESGQVFRRLIDLQTRPTDWPADAPKDVPEWLVRLILDLLSIEPEQRPASALEVVRRLEAGPNPLGEVAPAEEEELRARGFGVLALRNEADEPTDDWLGYAIANTIWRTLTELPGVYVAGQDALATLLRRLEIDEARAAPRELLEGSRLVGAGTLITGSFRRLNGTLRIDVELLTPQQDTRQPVGRVEGPVDELPALEAAVDAHVLRVLGLEGITPPVRGQAAPAPAYAAQERFVLAKQAYLRGDYDEAIALAEEAMQHQPQFAEAIGFTGVCLARMGRYAEGEARHREQETLALSWNNARLRVEALANLGVMNYFRGEYHAAEECLRDASELAERCGLATEHAQIFNNLGFVLVRLGHPEEAKQAFGRAIEAHRAFGGLTSLVGPYNGTGNVLVEQGRYDEAREYYRRALALAEEIGDRTSVGNTHTHLGRCAVLQERFAEAQHEFTMALSTLEETRFWNGLARAYEHIGDLNLRLGNYPEAARCADRRIELAQQHSNSRMESAAWWQKAEALRRLGDEEGATACAARGDAIDAGAATASDRER